MPASDDNPTITLSQAEKTVVKILSDLRKKLLDFSRKNNLINLKHSSRSNSHIRVIDVIPDQLFEKFLAGSRLQFKSLPDPDENIQDEQSSEFQDAFELALLEDQEYIAEMRELGDDPTQKSLNLLERKLKDRVRSMLGMEPIESQKITISEKDLALSIGLNPSYEMPFPNEADNIRQKHNDDYSLQTLLFPKQLENKVNKLYEQVRLIEQETGVNTLYCVFGFLEWYPDSRDKACISPLILCPLTIEREFKDGKALYYLVGRDEEVTVNLTLLERLKAEFGVELPEFAEDTTPEAYFKETQERLISQPDWVLKRYITIGLFSFARQMMYLDLDNTIWPQSANLIKNSLIKQIFCISESGNADATQGILQCAETYNPDHPEIEKKVPVLIYDSDSSQFSAITDVMEGKSLVVEGPPGTGKSQTITNIIANAIVDGKTVLFVAEKKTALDVVNKKLVEAGLGDFCLELHSNKTNKKLFYDSFKNRLSFKSTGLTDSHYRAHKTELSSLRDQLNQYASLVNTPYGEIQITIHNLFGRHQKFKSMETQLPKEIEFIEIKDITRLSQAELKRRQAILSAFETIHNRILQQYGSVRKHPWAFVQNPDLTILDKNKACYLLGQWRDVLIAINKNLDKFSKQHCLSIQPNLAISRIIVSGIDSTVEIKGDFDFILPILTGEYRNDFFHLIELHKMQENTTANINALIDNRFPIPSYQTVQVALQIAQESGLQNYTMPDLPQYLENIVKERLFWEKINTESLFSSPELLEQLVPYLSEQTQKEKIHSLAKLLANKDDILKGIKKCLGSEYEKFVSFDVLLSYEHLLSKLKSLGINNTTVTYPALMSLKAELVKYSQDISKLDQQISKILALVSPLIPANESVSKALLGIQEIIENVPKSVMIGSIPGIWDEAACLEIDEQRNNAILLKEQEQKFSNSFRFAFLEDYEQLKAASSVLVVASTLEVGLVSFLPFVNPTLAKAVRFFKQINKSGKKFSPGQMADEMMQLYFYHNEQQAYLADEKLKSLYGPLFKGIQTDFNEIKRIQEWGKASKVKLLQYSELGRAIWLLLQGGHGQILEQILEYCTPLSTHTQFLSQDLSELLTTVLRQNDCGNIENSESTFQYYLHVSEKLKQQLDEAIHLIQDRSYAA